MSLSPNEKYPGATEADPNYKDSKFKDNNPSTTNNGSPLKALDRNEQLALQEAMMNAAGFDYNGVVDTPQNSQMFNAYKAALSNGANLISNHNFLTSSPDTTGPSATQPPPSATPTSYPPGFQIFSGVFANETTGILNLTYIDGRVSFSGGDFYMSVPNTGGVERLTEFVASVADFDGKPRTRGVSYALVGGEYRVTVGVDALEDESANETLLGSVKFEQGSVATRHETESLSSRNLSDYTGISFETVSGLISGFPINSKAQSIVSTNGYNNAGDGGAARYFIISLSDYQSRTGLSSPDGDADHLLDNGLVAELICNDGLRFAQCGGLSDGLDKSQLMKNILKRYGKFASTVRENLNPYFEIDINQEIIIQSSVWCGYSNININCTSKIRNNLDNPFTGNSVLNFDYGWNEAPLDIQQDIIDAGFTWGSGGRNSWSNSHYINIINDGQPYWPNDNPITQAVISLDENPSIGEVVHANGHRYEFGIDVAIGSDASETRDNLLAALNANQYTGFFSLSTTSVISYESTPMTTFSFSNSVRVTKWDSGISAVRVNNNWNSKIEFGECTGFTTQLLEEPSSNTSGSTPTAFGGENNNYHFGKMHNCQVQYLKSAQITDDFVDLDLTDDVNSGKVPYTIDNVILGGSTRINNTDVVEDLSQKPHYVIVIAGRSYSTYATNVIEAETTNNPSNHRVAMILGDKWCSDNRLKFRSERYTQLGNIVGCGDRLISPPVGNTVTQSFNDQEEGETSMLFSDNTNKKENFSTTLYDSLSASLDVWSVYTQQIFASGEILNLRDNSLPSNVYLKGMYWYTSSNTNESDFGDSTFATPETIRVSGVNGVGTTVKNRTGDYSRYLIDFRGDDELGIIIRILDGMGNVQTEPTNFNVSLVGGSYSPGNLGFTSSDPRALGKAYAKVTIPQGYTVQVILKSPTNSPTALNVKSLRIMQYWNEPITYSDGYRS